MRLHLHEWGRPDAPPLVCLHGLTAHGARYRKLAEERLAGRFRVLAPDLRGHGRSEWEPPWDVEAHLEDVLETLAGAAVDRARWLGHSFGARLLVELTARRPELVERAVLLDPAFAVLPHVALDMAEVERADQSWASPEEAVEARAASPRLLHTPRELVDEEIAAHLERGGDGRWRYRYCATAVVAAWSELTRDPPWSEALRVPTLLVLAAESWLVLDEQRERLEALLADRLEIVTVPGGHTVLWDAFAETAGAIERFLT
jgi:lipase